MRALLLFFCSSLNLSSIAQDSIVYEVQGAIPKLKQEKSMDCWITVTTMMFSWKEDTIYSVKEFSNCIGFPWIDYYENNTGLTFEEQDNFISQIGMKSEPPANYTLEAYIDLLKLYGPLWITTGDGFSAHARLLYSITGDGSYDKSRFTFIDPASGKIVSQSAMDFFKEFEEEAIIANEESWERLRIQIYHF
ncbi:papain-like cysteine protease family protein [Fluviicola sp.]|uniref:papain-like cysteine protease family protein n=1 Tax=Fluviicola sp. TaxID=1917219 RepID=UPI003D2A7679